MPQAATLNGSSKHWSERVPWYGWLGAVVGIIALQTVILAMMGRLWICKCGYVKVWHGVIKSAENSQHLFDWFTMTHVIHGFAFYFLLWLFFRKVPAMVRLVLAVAIEGGWEVLENTSLVIERYRSGLDKDYYGDSIVNSIGDTIAAAVGYVIAMRLPAWMIVVGFIGVELGLAVGIRDNLTLNIIRLVNPNNPITRWQMGGEVPAPTPPAKQQPPAGQKK